MHKITYTIKFLLLLIFLNLFEKSIQANLTDAEICQSIDNCFDCVANRSLCQWSTTELTCSKNKLTDGKLYWTDLQACLNDAESQKEMSQYCGVMDIKFSDFKTTVYTSTGVKIDYDSKYKSSNKYLIDLPKVNKNYGKNNLLCKYKITVDNDESDQNNDFIIDFKFLLNNENIISQTLIELIDENDLQKPSTTLYANVQYQITSIKQITIYYYQAYAADTTPFYISLIQYKEKSSINIFVLILLILLCLVFIALIALVIYFIYKRATRQRTINERLEEYRQANAKKEAEINENRKKLMDYLIENVLKPINYENKNEKMVNLGKNCTICLDNFNEGDKVSITECGHIFHAECIKKWLTDHVFDAKCPNCNYHFVHDKENKENLGYHYVDVGNIITNEVNNNINNSNSNNNSNNNSHSNLPVNNGNSINNRLGDVREVVILNTNHSNINNENDINNPDQNNQGNQINNVNNPDYTNQGNQINNVNNPDQNNQGNQGNQIDNVNNPDYTNQGKPNNHPNNAS